MTEFRPHGFQRLTNVVKNLIIINVLVFLLQKALASRGIDLDIYFGLHYWQSPFFRWWQPLTHMFMHGSIEHIAFNMFALWMFGNVLENVWGPKRFLIFYLICGLGAAICHEAVLTYEFLPQHSAFIAYNTHPDLGAFVDFVHTYHIQVNPAYIREWSEHPDSHEYITDSISALQNYFSDPNIAFNEATIGASGAVFGLLFAFGYLFPNQMLYLYFAIPVKAKWFVTGYAIIELFSGVRNSAGDNVAHFAHLGGMLFAFILLRIWNDKTRNHFY